MRTNTLDPWADWHFFLWDFYQFLLMLQHQLSIRETAIWTCSKLEFLISLFHTFLLNKKCSHDAQAMLLHLHIHIQEAERDTLHVWCWQAGDRHGLCTATVWPLDLVDFRLMSQNIPPNCSLEVPIKKRRCKGDNGIDTGEGKDCALLLYNGGKSLTRMR